MFPQMKEEDRKEVLWMTFERPPLESAQTEISPAFRWRWVGGGVLLKVPVRHPSTIQKVQFEWDQTPKHYTVLYDPKGQGFTALGSYHGNVHLNAFDLLMQCPAGWCCIMFQQKLSSVQLSWQMTPLRWHHRFLAELASFTWTKGMLSFTRS